MAPYGLLGAFVTGIVLAVHLSTLPVQWCWLSLAVLAAWWIRVRYSATGWLPFLCAVALAGHLLTIYDWGRPLPEDHVSRFAGNRPVILEARLLSAEPTADRGHRLLMDARWVSAEDQLHAVHGRLLFYVREGELQAQPGQIIRSRARISRPHLFGTPGEFNYPLYLASRGIYATAFLKNAGELTVMANHPAAQSFFWERLRGRIARQIAAGVPGEAASLVKALVVGMRAGISDKQRDLLNRTGVSHLFAISGLHFGLLALMLYQICIWCYRRSVRLTLWCPPQRIIPPLLVAPLCGYLMLSGNSWATQRAFLMFAIAGLLLFIRRRTPPMTLLAIVALILLILNPLALYQPGFQLSFAGLAGILLLLPRWKRSCSTWPFWLRAPWLLLLTTSAAMLSTLPLVLWHFHILAPAGLLANLVALPLIAWGAVPAGLFGAFSISVQPNLADAAFQLSGWLVQTAVTSLTWLMQASWLHAHRFYLTAADMVCLSGLVGILLLGAAHRRYFRLWPGALVLTGLLAWTVQPTNDGLRVTAVSVGQGDAILVSFDNRHYLVDGGGMPRSDFDPGERLLAPALGRLGVRQLEGVILTHNHPDHRDGLAHILAHFPIKHFWSALPPAELPSSLRQQIERRRITGHCLPEGWTVLWQNGPQKFRVFTPDQRAVNLNERSVVVLASDARNSLLLTGDLGEPGLRQLTEDGPFPPVDLLKLPHHGSRHSAPEQYLNTFKPSRAFVSSGLGNRYHFPHKATVNFCNERKIPLYRTDLMGTLVFRSEQDGWYITLPAAP